MLGNPADAVSFAIPSSCEDVAEALFALAAHERGSRGGAERSASSDSCDAEEQSGRETPRAAVQLWQQRTSSENGSSHPRRCRTEACSCCVRSVARCAGSPRFATAEALSFGRRAAPTCRHRPPPWMSPAAALRAPSWSSCTRAARQYRERPAAERLYVCAVRCAKAPARRTLGDTQRTVCPLHSTSPLTGAHFDRPRFPNASTRGCHEMKTTRPQRRLRNESRVEARAPVRVHSN
jgi:hypothetical protein